MHTARHTEIWQGDTFPVSSCNSPTPSTTIYATVASGQTDIRAPIRIRRWDRPWIWDCGCSDISTRPCPHRHILSNSMYESCVAIQAMEYALAIFGGSLLCHLQGLIDKTMTFPLLLTSCRIIFERKKTVQQEYPDCKSPVSMFEAQSRQR